MGVFVNFKRLTRDVWVMRIHSMSIIQTSLQVPKNLSVDDYFLTVENLSQIICINKYTIYHLLKKDPDKLPQVTRIWGRVLFKRSAVNSFIKSVGSNEKSDTGRRGRGRPPKSEKISVGKK